MRRIAITTLLLVGIAGCSENSRSITASVATPCRSVIITSIAGSAPATRSEARCDVPSGEGVYVSIDHGDLQPLTEASLAAIKASHVESLEIIYTSRQFVPDALGGAEFGSGDERNPLIQQMEDPDAGGGEGPIACALAFTARALAQAAMRVAITEYFTAVAEANSDPGNPMLQAAVETAQQHMIEATAAFAIAQLAVIILCVAPTP